MNFSSSSSEKQMTSPSPLPQTVSVERSVGRWQLGFEFDGWRAENTSNHITRWYGGQRDKQVGKQMRDIYVSRVIVTQKNKHIKDQRHKIRNCLILGDISTWRLVLERKCVRGMAARRREDRIVGNKQEISGRESKTSLCWEEEEAGGGMGAENRDMETRESAYGWISGTNTHKANGPLKKTSEMLKVKQQHSNTFLIHFSTKC